MNASFDVTGIALETKRLRLRPFEEKDLEDLFAYARVPGVGEKAGWSHHKDQAESQRILAMFIAEKKTFALVDKESGKVIGSLGVERYGLEDRLTEFRGYRGRSIGYVLGQDYWGRGLMTEALQAVMDYLFDVLDYDFLLAGYYDHNDRSRRVQEKCGFRPYRKMVFDTSMGQKEPGVLTLKVHPKKEIRFKFSHPETLIWSEN